VGVGDTWFLSPCEALGRVKKLERKKLPEMYPGVLPGMKWARERPWREWQHPTAVRVSERVCASHLPLYWQIGRFA
jgi:hypothetical protein